MPAHVTARARAKSEKGDCGCGCGGVCGHAVASPHGDPVVRLQRLAGNRAVTSLIQRLVIAQVPVEGVPPVVERVLASPGLVLDPDTRAFVEPRFGEDFSDVRIHTDGEAAESALAVNSRAFTVGRHVVFGPGQYAPTYPSGRRLLLHELAHVVQQSRGRAPASGLRSTLALETAAADASSAVAHGGSVTVSGSAGSSVIQRQVLVPDAAGGCGVCQGPPVAGEIAHQLIQEEFEILFPLALVEFPFASPTDENGRLDLAVATPDGLRIGEIKPANPDGYARGAADMAFYTTALAGAYPGTTVQPLEIAIPPEVTAFPNGLPECPTQVLFVNPPIDGIYGYYCQPPFRELVRDPRCTCDERPQPVPVPVPVPAPRSVTEREQEGVPVPPTPSPIPVPARREALKEISDFIKRVVESGEDADRAAREFVQAHPELVGLLAGAAVVIVVATIVEDVATAGIGLLDDPASLAVAYALVRAATSR